MIYAPDTVIDKELLKHSRELVRKATALLRKSDHLISAQRLRDELGQPRDEPSRERQGESGQDKLT